MAKIPVSTLVLGTALIVALITAGCSVTPPTSTEESRLPLDAPAGITVGMGDLHLVDGGQAIPITGGLESTRLNAGMGDLQYFQAVQDGTK